MTRQALKSAAAFSQLGMPRERQNPINKESHKFRGRPRLPDEAGCHARMRLTQRSAGKPAIQAAIRQQDFKHMALQHSSIWNKSVKINWKDRAVEVDGTTAFQQARFEVGGKFLDNFHHLKLE